MKKVQAGHWIIDNFYAYRDEMRFWNVGEIIKGESLHLEDFKTLREARQFLEQKRKEINGRKR